MNLKKKMRDRNGAILWMEVYRGGLLFGWQRRQCFHLRNVGEGGGGRGHLLKVGDAIEVIKKHQGCTLCVQNVMWGGGGGRKFLGRVLSQF